MVYFALGNDEHDGLFLVVTKEFWDENHCLDDQHISSSVTMPGGFVEVEESIFQYLDGTVDDGVDKLLVCGFIEHPLTEIR